MYIIPIAWIPTKPSFLAVIECDGYETHGTRDKFTTDRQRDRCFLEKGYQVRRFSGAEIIRDPIDVGGELAEWLHRAVPIRGKYAGLYGKVQ